MEKIKRFRVWKCNRTRAIFRKSFVKRKKKV